MKAGTRTTLKVIETQPKFKIKEISREDIKDYMGIQSKRKRKLIFNFIHLDWTNNFNLKKG